MNIRLEPLTVEHANNLFIFETENRVFFETMVPSRGNDYYRYDGFLKALNDLVEEQKRGEGNYFLIMGEGESILGRINLFNIRKEPNFSADLGYRVGKKFLGKKVASKSLEQLLKKVTGEHKVVEIRAKTTSHNIGSQKLLEKHHFIIQAVKVNEAILNDQVYDFLEYYWSNL